MNGDEAYVLSRIFTEETFNGGGAAAGKSPIPSHAPVYGGNQLTFTVTDNEGHTYSDSFVVRDGMHYENFDDYAGISVNVKDYGAVGDGVTDDSQAFIDAMEDAVAQNKTVILIPRGSYELNHEPMEISKLSFVGENPKITTILNANITAPSGIECISLAFDGGTTRTFGGTGTADSGMAYNVKQETVIIRCTPTTNTDVHYKNCIFRNAGTASLAYQNAHGTGNKFTADIIEDCLFENLLCIGVYHSLDIDEAIYRNNVFQHIGSTKEYTTTGYLSWCGLKSGDTTNSDNKSVANCTIANCRFEDIITLTHITGIHSDEAYFVGFHGENLTVCNCVFKDLNGYAHDREGLYTKARKTASIYNNYFENAGLGEGYVCAKQAEDRFPERSISIHDNTFVGTAGTAVVLYAGGEIYSNTIKIENTKGAINCVRGEGEIVKIFNNLISCGVDDFYYNGTLISAYHGDDYFVIKVTNHDDVEITDNIVVLDDNLSDGDSVIFKLLRIQTILHTITCSRNKLYANSWNCGIHIINATTLTGYSHIDAEINDNTISILPPSNSQQSQPIRLQLVNDNAVKHVTAKNNVIYNSTYAQEGIRAYFSQSGTTYTDNDKSFIEFDTQQPNLTWRYSSGRALKTNANYVNVPSESLVAQL